jgi:hypothetical protein
MLAEGRASRFRYFDAYDLDPLFVSGAGCGRGGACDQGCEAASDQAGEHLSFETACAQEC